MLNFSHLFLCIVLPLVLFWPSFGQTDNHSIVSNDAVANERPPLTGDDLAKYWGLNCQQIATTTQGWAEQELLQHRPDMDAVNWQGLELCAMIYNVRDTGRYQPCPNYGRALLDLKSMGSGKTKADPLIIAGYLMSCNKSQ